MKYIKTLISKFFVELKAFVGNIVKITDTKKLIGFAVFMGAISMLAGIILILFPRNIHTIIAQATGWIAFIINLLPLFIAAKFFKAFNSFWLKIMASAIGILFVVYSLNVLFNFNTLFPQITAIAFNIGDSLKGIGLFYFIITGGKVFIQSQHMNAKMEELTNKMQSTDK